MIHYLRHTSDIFSETYNVLLIALIICMYLLVICIGIYSRGVSMFLGSFAIVTFLTFILISLKPLEFEVWNQVMKFLS